MSGSIYGNCLIISDLEFAFCIFFCTFFYFQNRDQASAKALSVKPDLFCSNLIHENIKKDL